MRCIIVDDEPKAIDILQRYVNRLPGLHLQGSFRDPLSAQPFLETTPTDLIFLDINMPGRSGIQVLAAIKNPPLVIFTTAYPEYAVQSYELEAVDYLLKPVTFARFEKAVIRAEKIFRPANPSGTLPEGLECIELQSGAQTYRVKTADIRVLKKEGNYFTVFTTGKKIVIRQNMETALQMLPSDLFRRVHRSYIISLRHVTVVGKHSIQVGEYTVPVSASYREMLGKR